MPSWVEHLEIDTAEQRAKAQKNSGIMEDASH
jgi:hypothetical protein